MARCRPKINNNIKEQLKQEAGNKCANPGCSSRRTHLHHIRKWAVYETHDAQHMIAVCPTCHDAIHHGSLPISDAKVYEWRQIARSQSTVQSYLYVEPGVETKILLGTIAVVAKEVVVFRLVQNNRLKFSVVDEGILLFDLRISSMSNKEILRVVNNYVRHNPNQDVSFKDIPGHIQVTASVSSKYVPTWAIQKMRMRESLFASNSQLKLLSLEVIRPGVVRVEGVWAEHNRVIIVTREQISFITPDMSEPLNILGGGENSTLLWDGPITASLFGFG